MGAQGAPRSNVEQGGGSSSETGKPLSRRRVRVLTEEQKKENLLSMLLGMQGYHPRKKNINQRLFMQIKKQENQSFR